MPNYNRFMISAAIAICTITLASQAMAQLIAQVSAPSEVPYPAGPLACGTSAREDPPIVAGPGLYAGGQEVGMPRQVPYPDATLVCVASAREDAPVVQAPVPYVEGLEFAWELRVLDIEYVLQGTPREQVTIQNLLPPESFGTSGMWEFHQIESGKRYLFSLDAANHPEADFMLVPNQSRRAALIPLVPVPPGDLNPSSTPASLIAAEFAAALRQLEGKDLHRVLSAMAPAFVTPAVREELNRLADGDDVWESLHALSILSGLQDSAAFEELLDRLLKGELPPLVGDTDYIYPVRMWVGSAFVSFRQPAAREALTSFIRANGVDGEFIEEALRTLIAVSGYTYDPVLVELLDHPNLAVKFAAAHALFLSQCNDDAISSKAGLYYPSDLEKFKDNWEETVTAWKAWDAKKHPQAQNKPGTSEP